MLSAQLCGDQALCPASLSLRGAQLWSQWEERSDMNRLMSHRQIPSPALITDQVSQT